MKSKPEVKLDQSQELATAADESLRPAQGKAALEIGFGALCHPIAKQLKDQGVTMNVGIRGSVGIWQRDADAITRLAVRQLLPDSVVHKSRQKLIKKIIAGIEASQQ